jgi:hypothetical protein
VAKRRVEATSVVDFISAVGDFSKRATSIHSFRGQRNAEWLDYPALLREPAKLLPYEYDAVRDLHAVHPQEFYQDTYMFDKLVRMQHYGLPTRLLDVSSNPLVALYFATEPYRSTSKTVDGLVVLYDVPKARRKYFDSDSISCVANLANLLPSEKEVLLENIELEREDFNKLDECDRLVQFIRAEKSHFRPRIEPSDLIRTKYVTPKMQNRRIVAQHGAFLLFGLKSTRVPRDATKTDTIMRELIYIPQSAKSTIRRQLDDLGINDGTLFPELSHAATDIVRRYTQ